jgi:hypothetical protein
MVLLLTFIPWCCTEHRSPLRKGPKGHGKDAARFSRAKDGPLKKTRKG